MGEGSCIDDERREIDAYYTNIDTHPDITAARCAQLCTEQPLCIGLGWNEIISECENLFPDGEAESLAASYDGWYSYLGYTGHVIQDALGRGYYDYDLGFDCYRKGIFITQFRKNSLSSRDIETCLLNNRNESDFFL